MRKSTTILLIIGISITGFLVSIFLLSPYSTALLKSKKHFIEHASINNVFYEPGAQSYADQIALFLAEAIDKVERTHGLPFKEPFNIYVCHSQESLNEYIAHNGQSRIRGTVVFGDVFIAPSAFHWKGRDTHRESLVHELSHLHLRQNLGFLRYRMNIPVWFHEGLANLTGGSGGESIMEEEAIRAILEGQHFVPDEKGNLFKVKRARDYGLNYPMFHKQSKLFLTYISETRKPEFKNFLIDIQTGRSFGDSFKKHLGFDVQGAWEEFIEYLERNYHKGIIEGS